MCVTVALDESIDSEVIVLEDDDGIEHNFVLGEVLSVNEKQYAVLLPIDDDDEEGVIFRIEDDPDASEGELHLCDIEDDNEWQTVVDAYNASIDEEAE